jgi:hypothetical protein
LPKNKLSNNTKIISLILFITFIGIAFGYNSRNVTNSKTQIVTLPKIKSNPISLSKNKTNNITTVVSLELDKKTAKKVNVDELQLIVTETINSLDYDKLTGVDNIRYMKDSIYDELSKNFTSDQLSMVYVTDVFNGGYEPPAEKPIKQDKNKTAFKNNNLFKKK